MWAVCYRTEKSCVCKLWQRGMCVCEVTQPLRIFPRTIYSKHLDPAPLPLTALLVSVCLVSIKRNAKTQTYITENCCKPPNYTEEKGA